VRWRAVGEIMAISSPFFDSEILGAWAYNEEVRQEILAAFPDRQVIELDAIGNDTTFRDAVTPNMP
jgi:hypothetical protein